MTPVWNSGLIAWNQVSPGTNVVQVAANPADPAVQIYWWRNLLQGEDTFDALRQFIQQFSFAQFGATAVAATAQEWQPTQPPQLIRDLAFSFTTSEINLPLGE